MQFDFDNVIDRTGTNCSKWDKRNLLFGREDILPLWVADTDFKAPEEVICAMKKRVEHGIFGYTFKSESYYNSIIKWMRERHEWDIRNEWITFSPGIVSAINIAINTFTNYGDKVIIQSPIYPPFYSAIEKNGRIIIDNELLFIDARYYMDINSLNNQIRLKDTSFTSNTSIDNLEVDDRVKLLLLCNPHNPTGRVWTKEELLKIGDICFKNNILIVSDEIHSDIVYKGNKHISIASLSEELEQITITCMSPSKTFNLAGLSTSVVIIPNRKIRSMYNNTLQTLNLGGGNIFGNIALEAAYTYGERWLAELVLYLEENLNYLIAYFKDNIPEIKPIQPDGTYLVWLNCDGLGLEGRELMDFFVNDAKVGVNPGSTFGENGKRFVRLNFGCSRSILEEALKRIEHAVKVKK